MHKSKINEVKIYKAYVKAKVTKGYSVIKLSEKLGISRQVIYSIVRRIEKGNENQLNICLTKSKYDCLWEYKYKQRFLVVKEMRGKDYSKQIKLLVQEMHNEDGFGIRDISRRFKKDPSTISQHLKIYK